VNDHDVSQVREAVRASLDEAPRVVLAVSGGLDSMVLLDAAASVVASGRLIVATFDHGSGPSATAATHLVIRRAGSLGLRCETGRADGELSSEAALRDARWEFLRIAAEHAGAVVCTAHTSDDQIETVLMRTLRGAGARGLAALYAPSPVLRPLLAFRRSQVAAYAAAADVRWMEDPTNQSRRFFRNRVRHDLLPALRRVNAGIDEALLVVARRAAEWREEMDAIADQVEHHVVARHSLDVSAAALASFDRRSLGVLWPSLAAKVGLALDWRGTNRVAAFTEGARARTGARVQLSGGWEVTKRRDSFELRKVGMEAMRARKRAHPLILPE
jgi:tRNA(Ile)-lysidine synthase